MYKSLDHLDIDDHISSGFSLPQNFWTLLAPFGELLSEDRALNITFPKTSPKKLRQIFAGENTRVFTRM